MSNNIKFSGYSHRFLARIVIEAKTPLAVGSGDKDVLTDALVATDINGLPYIPGTAIAGVVRHMIDEIEKEKDPERFKKLKEKQKESSAYFGYHDESDGGRGSEIIFTEAKILNSEGKVIDGMNLKAKEDSLLKQYDELPIRQHVRINDRGVAEKAGKFDEQVVFAGTRFCFELEMVAENDVLDNFNKILDQIQSKSFRIGGGTRCGFGEIKVQDLQTRILDLRDDGQRKEYLEKSSELNSDFWHKEYACPNEKELSKDWVKYELHLAPEDFFLFGSGFGDAEVDMTPVKEKKVVWKDGRGELTEELVLIPATSVKGALAHRTAFHYNKLMGVYADNLKTEEERKSVVGKNNKAVKALFGSEGEIDKETNKMRNQVRGNVLFSDVIEMKPKDKILNHVSIDRFTGGAIDGALFSEKTIYGKGQVFELTILVNEKAFCEGEKIQDAFEDALKDICKGMLPLGGGVNRGNGVFTGSLNRTKD
ncbi:MAG: RAMP superfamily CRISPR-associated protein [Paludibacteraceae bacterium]